MEFHNNLFYRNTYNTYNLREIKKKICKKVSFKTTADVILIPCINDYKDFLNELWYNDIDYYNFRISFFNDK